MKSMLQCQSYAGNSNSAGWALKSVRWHLLPHEALDMTLCLLLTLELASFCASGSKIGLTQQLFHCQSQIVRCIASLTLYSKPSHHQLH